MWRDNYVNVYGGELCVCVLVDLWGRWIY